MTTTSPDDTTHPPVLTKEKREALKQACCNILANDGINPRTKRGQQLIAMFWLGALNMQHALTANMDPSATMLVTCGRVEELIAKEQP
jgi:hypothetical protein